MFCFPACFGWRSIFPGVVAKVIYSKNYGALPSMLLLRTDSLSSVCLQDGSRSVLFLLAHSVRNRHVDRRTELWSRAGELTEAFDFQFLDNCYQSFLICIGRISMDSFLRVRILVNTRCSLFQYLDSWFYFVKTPAICQCLLRWNHFSIHVLI